MDKVISKLTIVSSQGVKTYCAIDNISIEKSHYRFCGDPYDCFKVFRHVDGNVEDVAEIRCIHNVEIEYVN